jgi:putative DNA primase/helicase
MGNAQFMDTIATFTQAMRENGIETEATIQADGQRHRFRVIGDKSGSDNGWYVLHLDGVPAGAFGCWKRGISETWCAKSTSTMTDIERQALTARIEASKREQEAETARVHADCKAKAERLWNEASETMSADHAYLSAKVVRGYGLRELGDALLVPVRADDGGLVGLQFIQPDGSKRFLTGTPKAGNYHRITGSMERVLICEGYATGASLHEATGFTVVIAFDAGNLLAVSQALRAKLPDAVLVLCADDDRNNPINTGITKATAAALAVGGLLATPIFAPSDDGTDFNDMHQQQGIDAVRAAVLAAKVSEKLEFSVVGSDHKKNSINPGITTDTEVQETEQAMIARLAGLSDIAYFRTQKVCADVLELTASQLDKLVKAEKKRQAAEAGSATEGGSSVMFDDVEPWPEAVSGAALLDELAATIRRFVVCERHTADAAALWLAFTWLIDALSVAPIANITAPLPNCGKSTMLDLFERLSYRPLKADNISAAALFRSIEKWRPSLLIDEVDAFLKDNEDARGILNSGHKRNGFVLRVVGDDFEPRRFSTWGAKALCGIGSIAATLQSRSIRLELRRKLPGESVENLRHVDGALIERLQRKLARFAEDVHAEVKAARPAPAIGLSNRAQDNWEPLLAIADAAGGQWPDRARKTAQAIAGTEAAHEAPDANTVLLADIRAAFERLRADRASSADLLAALCEDEEAPWSTWNRGKPMSPKQLSTRLGEFGIVSGSIRRANGSTPKGYYLDKFKDAFSRYLPISSAVFATTPQPSNGGASSGFDIRHKDDLWRQEKDLKPNKDAGCGVVADRNPQTVADAENVSLIDYEEGFV